MGQQSLRRVIGSHNTFSYLPVEWWIMKFFRYVGKCQSKDILEQLKHVNCIDVRLIYTDKGWQFCHGYMIFDGDAFKMLNIVLQVLNKRNKSYCRLILENIYSNKYCEIDRFKQLCEYLANHYPNIVFFGGNLRETWEKLYDFKSIGDEDVNQFVSSMQSNARWYERFIPWLYAKRMNKHNAELAEVHKINLYDFI